MYRIFHHIVFICLMLGLCACRNEQPQIPQNKLPKDMTKENLLEMNRILAEKEKNEILKYIEQSGIDYAKSPLEFWYKIEKQGDGYPIKKGSKVKILYTLSLLDGTVCYTPENEGEAILSIGKYDIIKGLDEAVMMLNEGGKGKFIIPSDLAFGMIGDQKCIGAKKTVIYDIQFVEIVP